MAFLSDYVNDYDNNNDNFTNDIEVSEVDCLNSMVGNFSNLLIMHINIRSINKNINNLIILIHEMIKKPDVIICTETWNLECPDLYAFDNYQVYYNGSRLNQSDGVIIFVNKNIQHNIVIEYSGVVCIISAHILMKNSILLISGLYRSHEINKKIFITDLKLYLDNNKNIDNHIIVGDFNIDHLNNDIDSNNFVNNFLEKKFMPKFFSCTRSNDRGGGSCIDNMFCKINNLNTIAIKLKYRITDHYPIILAINTEVQTIDKKIIKSKYDYNKMQSICSSLNWDDSSISNDVNFLVDSLINKIKFVVNSSQIISKIKIKIGKRPRKSWITKGLINSCNYKNKLYTDWQNDLNNIDKKNRFKKYANKLKNLIRYTKNNYDKATIKNCDNNPKKLWNIVNYKIGKKEKRSKVDSICINDKEIINKLEIAKHFNEYFTNVGVELAESFDKEANKSYLFGNCKLNDKSIFFDPTDNQEIYEIIKDLRNKSGGVDKINAAILKNISKYLINPLTNICNLIISTAIFPNALKIAEIIPIFKAGNRKLMTNYRPISMVSNLAKIVEKLLHNRLYVFLNNNNVFSDNQFGFRKGFGTKHAIAKVTDFICTNLDKSLPVTAVFLDLTKAFDTVDHEILLLKLERYGIRGLPLVLMKNYLENRFQYTCVEGNRSNKLPIRVGVPQGTILGPLLFIVYINDLIDIFDNKNIVSYADDTVVFASECNWENTKNRINNYLITVSKWLEYNKLTLNVNKTVYISFINYIDKNPGDINIKIKDIAIRNVESTKYLGIIFDKCMKWNYHINSVVNRLKYLLYIFAKVKNSMSKNNLLILYYGLFNSVASYGIIAWGSAYQNAINPLENLRKKVLKLIGCFKDGSEYPLSLMQLYKLGVIEIYYDDLKKILLCDSKITRFKLIKLPVVKLEIGRKSCIFNAIKFFNELPMKYKVNLSNKKKYIKNCIKRWIIESDKNISL